MNFRYSWIQASNNGWFSLGHMPPLEPITGPDVCRTLNGQALLLCLHWSGSEGGGALSAPHDTPRTEKGAGPQGKVRVLIREGGETEARV